MIKKLFFFLYLLFIFHSIYSQNITNKKTCFIPISEAYPNRYFYHTPFQYNRFDSKKQLLCKGNFTVRYQQNYDSDQLASLIFDNPIIATMNNSNNNYNAGILGLGFESNTHSKSFFKANRNSVFINCTVEIARVNLPYYLHIGIPIQRTEQKITINETIITDEKVIKGGFVPEYQPTSASSLEMWQTTPSPILHSLPNMTTFLKGKGLGNRTDAIYGTVTQCPMTLWALADIYIQLGYDGFECKNIQGGYYLRGIIPTSPTLKSTWNRFLFYPVIGNVDRAEFGIGINGNAKLKDCDSINQTIYFDAYAGYLNNTTQMRPFDLNNGFFTRYGQVKLFDALSLNYKNKAIWAADITTLEYCLGNAFKSEIVFDFVHQYFQSFFNIGYSFKSQSKEQINCTDINNVYNKINPYIYGYSPQQYIQTPNPIIDAANNWTCELITPRSNMTTVAREDISLIENSNSTINGVPISQYNQLLKTDLNLQSGLMNLQILNIFFIGYTYEKIKTEYNTIIGIKGAISTSNEDYYTAPFYEIALSLELDY